MRGDPATPPGAPSAASPAGAAQSLDTEATIARKRQERAEKRRVQLARAREAPRPETELEDLTFKRRHVVSFGGPARGRSIRVMTWNILAQALVKRDLFPGSDLLRHKDRRQLPTRQICCYQPHVACLQEVDRLEDHAPALREAGYDVRYETGYADKLHGLLLAWKTSVFRCVGERLAHMDELALGDGGGDDSGGKQRRTGLTRVTRNIGFAAALQFVDEPDSGIICAHAHMFWHAKYFHERARQIGFWLREVRDFRRSRPEWTHWPLVFAGDLNTQPYEPAYRLLVGAALLPRHVAMLEQSRVVHATVDESKPTAADDAEEGEGGGEGAASASAGYADEEGDEDQALKACRPARPSDGLLTTDELVSLFADETTGRALALRSTYGEHYGRLRTSHDEAVETFGGRAPDEGTHASVFDGSTGRDEPRWTSVTPLWRCTLDYIFLLEGEGAGALEVRTTGLLPLHPAAACRGGLPRKGVDSSDHMSLMAELDIGAPPAEQSVQRP